MPKAKALPRGGGATAAANGVAHRFNHNTLEDLFQTNKEWADAVRETDPEAFQRLATSQSPEFLYIGCADSRCPPNQIMGLAPGDVFVQRNVGNQCLHHDMNTMSAMEYSVKALKVKTIIVCGHYNCGACKAALCVPPATGADQLPSTVNHWIADIREARKQGAKELAALDGDAAVARLCELNVMRQVVNCATSPTVQAAWAAGTELHVWGMIYDVADGSLKPLTGPLNSESDVDALRLGSAGAPAKGKAPAAKAAKAPAKKRARAS